MQALMTDLGLKRDSFWKYKVRSPSSIGLRTGPLYFEGLSDNNNILPISCFKSIKKHYICNQYYKNLIEYG